MVAELHLSLVLAVPNDVATCSRKLQKFQVRLCITCMCTYEFLACPAVAGQVGG